MHERGCCVQVLAVINRRNSVFSYIHKIQNTLININFTYTQRKILLLLFGMSILFNGVIIFHSMHSHEILP